MLIKSKDNSRESYNKVRKILDKGSFMEIGERMSARLTNFYNPTETEESDGVITGYGTINGKLVYIFCQDNEVMGGTFGEMHGQKIIGIYQKAIKAKAPIIGLLDCAGFRIEEGLDGLNSFAMLYKIQSMAAKIVPQVMVVIGQCGGGMSVVANNADFTFIEKEKGDLFVNPQQIVENTIGANLNKEEFSDGKMTFNEIIKSISDIVDLIPSNTDLNVEKIETCDDLNRKCYGLEKSEGDSRKIIIEIADDKLFFETNKGWGEDIVTGFIRLNGYPVGVMANNIVDGKKRMTARGCDKGSSIIKICSKFNIPMLTITDTEGFQVSEEEEKYLPGAAARMIESIVTTEIPKINLITGTVYGSAYSMMNSKGLGADYVFIWEDAEVNIVKPRQAVMMIYGNYDKDKEKEYKETHSSPIALARHGYVDKIISKEDTRKYLVGTFETFSSLDYEK